MVNKKVEGEARAQRSIMEGWFENRKEVMGKDVEMDRDGRISKEQRELLQSKHTKHKNVVKFMGTSLWYYERTGRPANSSAHTRMHAHAYSSYVHLYTHTHIKTHFHTNTFFLVIPAKICTHNEQNASTCSLQTNNILGKIIIKSHVLT